MAAFGTSVFDSVRDITVEMAWNDSVDSLPPLSIAAFPDLIARDAILAMTSGRASKMIKSTPIGQVTRVSSRLSSKSVRSVTLPTGDVQYRYGNDRAWAVAHQDPPALGHLGCLSACHHTSLACPGLVFSTLID